MRARAWPGLLALGAACQLPPQGGDVVDPSVNACVVEEETDGPCGPESVCRGGICRARAADDLEVVFTVIRSAVSGTGNGQPELIQPGLSLEDLRRLREPDPLQPDRGTALDLTLPPFASLKVALYGPDPKLEPTSTRGCLFEDQIPFDRTLPVNVSLRPASGLRGLSLASFARNATGSSSASTTFTLQTTLQAPPADYDLYLLPTVSPACPIPPILWPSYRLVPGVNAPRDLELTSLTLLTLGGLFRADPALDLSTWRAHVVDSDSGLTISTSVGFVPTATAGQWRLGEAGDDRVYPLEYYAPIGVASPRMFLILSPPDGLGAPRLALDLDVLNPFREVAAEVSVDLGALSLSTVEVELRTERASDAGAQPAQVLLASPVEAGALAGAPAGLLAFFAVGPRPTDEEGLTKVTLLPGRYEATAAAVGDEQLDVGRRSFTFLPSPDGSPLAGFALPLAEREPLDVPILPPASDTPLPAVSFSVTPSLARPSLSARLFQVAEMAPRSSLGRTDAEGHLSTRTDAGRFDIALRLPAERGFPWLVRPDVDLPLGDDVERSLRVSLPVEVTGVALTSQGSALAGSLLRAHARLADGRHVLIAEGVIDSAGGYRLLLPSRL